MPDFIYRILNILQTVTPWTVWSLAVIAFGYYVLEFLERIAKALEERNEIAKAESSAWDNCNDGSRMDMLCRAIGHGLWEGRQ